MLGKQAPRYQTQSLLDDVKYAFQSLLDEGYFCGDRKESDVEVTWNNFKEALQEASETLPEMPKRRETDWVTDEPRSLSKKKCDAWLRLCGNGTWHTDKSLMQEYQFL